MCVCKQLRKRGSSTMLLDQTFEEYIIGLPFGRQAPAFFSAVPYPEQTSLFGQAASASAIPLLLHKTHLYVCYNTSSMMSTDTQVPFHVMLSLQHVAPLDICCFTAKGWFSGSSRFSMSRESLHNRLNTIS